MQEKLLSEKVLAGVAAGTPVAGFDMLRSERIAPFFKSGSVFRVYTYGRRFDILKVPTPPPPPKKIRPILVFSTLPRLL